MNPKARITYRFETAKTGGADGGRNGGRLVRIGPEGIRAPEDKRSAAGPVWPEELKFETDVIPWKSPFQDDPDALERLIRETDGQTPGPEPERGAKSGGGTRIRPVPERMSEEEPEHGAWIGGRPTDAIGGNPPDEWEAPIGGGDLAPAGYIVPRRRPPAPSWTRVAATVIGAVLTGALFGYLVMSLLVWQPGSPAANESGSASDEEPHIELPVAGTPGVSPEQPEGTGSPAAVRLPAVRYYVLQYGVFSTDAGLAEALAQLEASGYGAAADTADGFRVYAGIAESREAAEALAAKLDGVELYIRPLEVPEASPAVFQGQPEDMAEFMRRTNDLMRTMSGLSASLLAAGGKDPVQAEAWSDWETAHRSWTEAAGAIRDGSPMDERFERLTDSLGKASEAFAAYRGKPAPRHLWAVQSALIETAVAQRDWMRASGAL